MSLDRANRSLRSGFLLAAGILAGCASDYSHLAPASPEHPWPIHEADEFRDSAGAGLTVPNAAVSAPPLLVSTRRYVLPELIDLAQRTNPQTREAWERAREAAAQVGLVESAYLPQLSAEAIGGFQRTPLPIPSTLIPQGYFTSDTREVVPTLAVKWLLFDFGRKDGATTAARENSFVANVAFTGAHQKLAYAVSRDYFALGAARGKLAASEQALHTAQIDQEAVEARRSHGVATAVELAQAQRQTAQAQFNLARAQGAEQGAYQALLASVGVAPLANLSIAELSEQELPSVPPEGLERLITDALANRPDIIADLGKIRVAEANLRKEHADHNPSIALVTQAYQNIGSLSSQGSPYYSVDKPGWAVFLHFSWPLFDGGMRESRESMARAEVGAARDALDQSQVAAAKDVTNAYYALRTSLAEHDWASALVRAASTAHDAELDAYHHGVGTYTELVNGENALVQSRTTLEDAHADVLTAAAALALSTGSIVNHP